MQPSIVAKRIIAVSSTAALLALFSLVLTAQPLPRAFAAAPRAAPTVTAVSPSSAYNDADTPIVITGTNFSNTVIPTVRLGSKALPDVVWVNSTQLSATVPWGLTPGVYHLTVTNGDGQSGTLTNAFTVTQAIGVWTTSGPYGGWTNDMAVSPEISRTAFAAVSGAGLFRTEDGGDNWALALYDAGPRGVAYGIAPTNTLYYWGGSGLWKSDDKGLNFQRVVTESVTAFAPDPQNSQHLWFGRYNRVYDWTIGETKWISHSNGLPTTFPPVDIAVNPTSPSTVYVVYQNGQVYKTTNSGDNWSLASNNLPTLTRDGYKLAINPFAADVVLYGRFLSGYTGYRTVDGGANWLTVTMTISGTLSDFAFSPSISGTVFATIESGSYHVALSTDGGETWAPFGNTATATGMKISLGLDSTSGLPAYAGMQTTGVHRSKDGGTNWEVANNGITALQVGDLACTPGKPEKVFAAVTSGYGSDNAGHSWRDLQLPTASASNITISAQNPDVVYVSRGGYRLWRSMDSGVTWDSIHLPIWSTYSDTVQAFTAAPTSAAVLYAGGDAGNQWVNNVSIGSAFRSDDYGTTWTRLTLTKPISIVSDIAVDPTNSNHVYVGAGLWVPDMSPHEGKGIFYSPDGGTNWYTRTTGMGNVSVMSLAIHPSQPETLYAGAWLSSEAKLTVFKSTDAGLSWTPTALRVPRNSTGYSWTNMFLVIDPNAPDTVYAGTRYTQSDGLYRTTDGGATWTKAAGGLGQTTITSLAACSDSDRTIVYIATVGGLTSGGGSAPAKARAGAISDYFAGGIYQQTTSYGPSWVFLPLMRK